MDTLANIAAIYGLSLSGKCPTEIPNVGRDSLGTLFRQLGFRIGVELGVEQGVFSETLCKANPDMHLIAIDSWKAYHGYRDHVSQSKLDGFFTATSERMALHDCSIMRSSSADAVITFEDDSLDFVYIDANHELPYVMFDIIEWAKKVRPGGIVCGHDYYQSTRKDSKCHVVYAVDAYTRAYRIHPWFLLGTKEKISGQVRDTSRSWMWVKEG
jgi:hypothetical protein